MFSNHDHRPIRPTLALLTALLALAIGCTEKRPDKFAQGMGGNNLLKISTYDGEIFDLCTGGELASMPTSSAKELVVEDDMDELRSFSLVSYSAPEAALLPKDLPFYGRPHSCEAYKIMYRITNKYLKVFKVAQTRDIPFTERTYAEELADGQLAVPLLGYSVEYVRVEKRLNTDDEPTHEAIEVRVQNKSEATNYRFQKDRYVEFEALKKMDLFPTSFFGFEDSEHEWVYGAGIVESAQEDEFHEGLFLPFDIDMNPATRVRFCRTGEDQIALVNTTIDPNRTSHTKKFQRIGTTSKTQDSCVHNPTVMQIPVHPVDYRVATEGDEPGLREKEDLNTPWTKKPWLQVNFSQITSLFGTGTVERVEVSKNSLSFVMNYSQENKFRIRFTLVRRPLSHGLIGAYAYEKDLEYFYPLKWPVPIEARWQDDGGRLLDRENIIPRFDVKKRDHVIKYRFTNQSILRFTYHTERAFAAVNWALLQAGTGLRVELEKDAQGHYVTSPVGDARYNWVHLARSLTGADALGTAMVLADPVTGEALSAGYRIDLTAIENSIQRQIMAYIRGELGLTPKELIGNLFQSDSIPSLGSALNRTKSMTSQYQISDFLHSLSDSFEVFEQFPLYYGALGAPNHEVLFEPAKNGTKGDWLGQILAKNDPSSTSKFESKYLSKFTCDHGSHTFDRQIFSFLNDPNSEGCSKLKNHIAELRGVPRQELERRLDTDIMQECLSEVMDPYAVFVSTHELLHTLSLNHNFEGTFDSSNFYKAREMQPLRNDPLLGDIVSRIDRLDPDAPFASSASIMDYQSLTDHMLPIPGKADIQMLRYIYGPRILTADGDLFPKPVDNQIGAATRSVTEHLAANNKKLWPMATCNDSIEGRANPFCRAYDDGTTPMEVAQHYIHQYKISLAEAGLYYVKGQPVPVELVPLFRASSMLLPLRGIYDHWRLKLARFSGPNNRYLTNFSKLDSKAYFANLKGWGANIDVYNAVRAGQQSEEGLGDLQQWFNAAQLIKEFFSQELLFMPDRYCVVRSSANSQVSLVELGRLRDDITQRESVVVDSCRSPAVQDWLKFKHLELASEGPNGETEFGYELHSGRYSAGMKAAASDNYDFVGTQMDRLNGMMLATRRGATIPQLAQKNFYPTMLEEPDFRSELATRYFDRLRLGVKVADQQHPDTTRTYANFGREKHLLSLFASLLGTGLSIPDQPWASLTNTSPFQVLVGPSAMLTGKSGPVQLDLGGGRVLVVPTLNSYVALQLVEDFNRLSMSEGFLQTNPGGRLSLTESEVELLKTKLVSSLPSLNKLSPGFMPTSTMAQPMTFEPPKVDDLTNWLKVYVAESPSLAKTPQLDLALGSLFNTSEGIASNQSSANQGMLLTVLQVLKEVTNQSQTPRATPVSTTQPVGSGTNSPADQRVDIDATIASLTNNFKGQEPLDHATLMYFSQESVLARINYYQQQQETLERQLSIDPNEIAAQKELIFSVLRNLSVAGQF